MVEKQQQKLLPQESIKGNEDILNASKPALIFAHGTSWVGMAEYP